MEIATDQQMGRYCTIGIGGVAGRLYFPTSVEELAEVYAGGGRVMVIACGSNIVFADPVVSTLVSIKKMPHDLEFLGGGVVRVSAVVGLGRVIDVAAGHGFGGLHKLAGIPGTVGGAICMNAGANGVCVADCLRSVRVFCHSSGEVFELSRAELGMSYRSSLLQKSDLIVLSAEFRFERMDEALVRSEIEQTLQGRTSRLITLPNCGSVFKNPAFSEMGAGELIDKAGLKGVSVGGLRISPVHGNYFENTGNARYEDFVQLRRMCYTEVMERFGIELELEVKVIL